MMSLRVWLPGPMFLQGGLYLWSHVPSKGSLSGGLCPGSLCPGGLCQGVCVGGSLSGRPPNRDPPPPNWESGQYACYWNAFLFKIGLS